VIANHYNIPPDIAGATLMAAGASSPELFSSIVALFITHSSLGLGTVVGSEIFNQLIICAGAVFASKTGKLILDKSILAREVGFYALAIILLYLALQDTRPLDDDPDGPNYIYISFYQATLVFSGYILYVLVCSNFEAIVACASTTKRTVGEKISSYKKPDYGAAVSKRNLDQGKMEYLMDKKNLSGEPVGNWKSVEYYMPAISTDDVAASTAACSVESETLSDSLRRGALANSIRSVFSMRNNVLKSLVKVSERPSEFHDLHDVQINEYKNQISCFLFQRSIFYNKAYFGANAWQLRWFTISEQKISSVPDSCDPDNHRMRYPHFKAIDIDENHLIIRIVNPVEGKRDFYLMAPSKPIFDKVIEKMEIFMGRNCAVDLGEAKDNDDDDLDEAEFEGAQSYESLIEYSGDSSNLETIFFFLLFPLRLLMHFTVPDIRLLDENGEMKATIGKAYLSTIMCLVWLILGSYSMVASLEALAELMDIPDAVIGFTVSAAGNLEDNIRLVLYDQLFSILDQYLMISLSLSLLLSLFRNIPPKLCSIKGCC
jgi:Ca2+/Na+ antiporter